MNGRKNCGKYNKSFWDPDQSPPAVKQNPWDAVTNLQSAGWQVENAYIQVADNGLKSILGRGYLKKLGLQKTQELYGSKTFGKIMKLSLVESDVKLKLVKKIRRFFHQGGIREKLSSTLKILQNFTASHQNERRIPVNRQDKNRKELKCLRDSKQFKKCEKCPNK